MRGYTDDNGVPLPIRNDPPRGGEALMGFFIAAALGVAGIAYVIEWLSSALTF